MLSNSHAMFTSIEFEVTFGIALEKRMSEFRVVKQEKNIRFSTNYRNIYML